LAAILKQSYPENASFGALNVAMGTMLTLEMAQPFQREQVRIIGCEPDQGVIVSPPQGSMIQHLKAGDVLKGRFIMKTGVVSFKADLISIANSPFPHMFLSYPRAVEVRKVRGYERINTRISANINSDFNINAVWPKEGMIEDLSKTGAKLRSRDRLGEFGRELLLDFDLQLADMTRTVSLAAIIRNAHVESEVIGEPHFVFGLQFLELNEDARLSLNNFIYEQH